MERKYCDICGKEISTYEEGHPVSGMVQLKPGLFVEIGFSEYKNVHYSADICKPCMNFFVKVIKNTYKGLKAGMNARK